MVPAAAYAILVGVVIGDETAGEHGEQQEAEGTKAFLSAERLSTAATCSR